MVLDGFRDAAAQSRGKDDELAEHDDLGLRGNGNFRFVCEQLSMGDCREL